MKTLHTDMLIIGGGINGTAIAADAAGRNLSVILCEQNDLASGTSSASTKLIHGGLRYLEQYQFKLIHEALKEREILMHRAPHLVHPLKFILPHSSGLRPFWMIRLGLFFYDHLAAHISLPKTKTIHFQHANYSELESKFKKGFSYYDCRTDDARLVISNALAAKNHGATIFIRTRCIAATLTDDGWHIELINQKNNQRFFIVAKVIINATGPWVKQVAQEIFHSSKELPVNLDQGSHIVVPQLYSGKYAYILQNADKRIIFTIPYENHFTLIGTTDIPFTKNPEQTKATAEEIQYLCHTTNQYFKKQITPEDCVWSYSGLRALYAANDDKKVSNISREYHIEYENLNGKNPLITIIGGKITTHRTLAEHVLKKLETIFPHMGAAWTEYSLLPGGFSNRTYSDFKIELQHQYPWLPEDLLRRYARQYGTHIHQILSFTQSIEDLGRCFGGNLYEKEVRYLIQHEWAESADDILWRRTKQGLFFNTTEKEQLSIFLATIIK